jgi:transcriptional regulator with XRE-family HTH domain
MEKTTVKETFWKMLPLKMKEANMKQIDLANAMSVNKATVNAWIHKRSFPEMNNIQEMADILGCSTDDLLGNNLQDVVIDFDKMLVAAYHAADTGTQASVRKLLDIKGK